MSQTPAETRIRRPAEELATGVLHNVGNALNSVTISAALVAEKVRKSQVSDLVELAALLDRHSGDLGTFITTDAKGKLVPPYLAELARHLVAERAMLLEELDSLTRTVEHVKGIITMQQSCAKVSAVVEPAVLAELVEDAIRINGTVSDRHGIDVVREFNEPGPVAVDRQKVVQILVNLISNARHALDGTGKGPRVLTLRIEKGSDGDECVRIIVTDNGVGIPQENLARIFAYGYTTKTLGHGFGLYMSALAAKAMGGSLSASSPGPGKGATFTLELPLKVVETVR